jgi:hypothetical protein
MRDTTLAVPVYQRASVRDTTLLGVAGDRLAAPLAPLVRGPYERLEATGDALVDAAVVGDSLVVTPKGSASGTARVRLAAIGGTDRAEGAVDVDLARLVTVSGTVRTIRDEPVTTPTTGVLVARGKEYPYQSDANGRFSVRVPAGVVELRNATNPAMYTFATSFEVPAAVSRDSIRATFINPPGRLTKPGYTTDRDTVTLTGDTPLTVRHLARADPDFNLTQFRGYYEWPAVQGFSTPPGGVPAATRDTFRIKIPDEGFPINVAQACRSPPQSLRAMVHEELPFFREALRGSYTIEMSAARDTVFRPGDLIVCAFDAPPGANYSTLASQFGSTGVPLGGYAIINTGDGSTPATLGVRRHFHAEALNLLLSSGAEINDCADIPGQVIPDVLNDFNKHTGAPAGQECWRSMNVFRPDRMNATVNRMNQYFIKPANRRAERLGPGSCALPGFLLPQAVCTFTTYGAN